MMPHMNGYEMIAALKAEEHLQAIPVIIITAGKIDSEKYSLSGANEIFQKPLSLGRLLEKAEALVSAAYSESKK